MTEQLEKIIKSIKKPTLGTMEIMRRIKSPFVNNDSTPELIDILVYMYIHSSKVQEIIDLDKDGIEKKAIIFGDSFSSDDINEITNIIAGHMEEVEKAEFTTTGGDDSKKEISPTG